MRPRNILHEIEARKYSSISNYPSAHIVPTLLPTNFRVITRFHKDVYCGEFTSDGKLFIAASKSGEIRVYRVGHNKMEVVKTYLCRDVRWSIIDCKLSPDQRFIAYSSWSGNVHFFPYQKKSCEMFLSLSDHSYYHCATCAFSVSFSADSTELIAGTTDGRAIIFDLERGNKLVSLDAHIADVNTITFSNQTNHIIYSGADDGILKVWDRRILSESHPEPVSIFIGHRHGITFQDSKGDFRYILTNSKDQTAKLWDTRRPSKLSDVALAQRVVRTNFLMLDYRNEQELTSLRPRNKLVFDPTHVDDSLQTFTGHTVSTTLIRARFSPSFSSLQKYAYSGSATGQLFIWDLASGAEVFRSKPGKCHKNVVRDVSWHPHEPVILTSSLDGTVGCTQWRDEEVECGGGATERYADEYMDEGIYWL